MKSEIKLDHLNFSVNNFQQSAAWYKKVFGFEIVEDGLYKGFPWGVLKKDESMLCIYEHKDRIKNEDTKYHKVSHFAFRINNKKEWENILKINNIKDKFNGPWEYPNSLSWYVEDPNGYEIEVTLWKNDCIKF